MARPSSTSAIRRWTRAASSPQPGPSTTRTNSAGCIGGPITKNKIFFFTNYDGYRYLSGLLNPTLQSIPTIAQRAGDFSELPRRSHHLRSAVADLRRRHLYAHAVRGKHYSRQRDLAGLAIVRSPICRHPTNSNIQNNYLASLPIQVNT